MDMKWPIFSNKFCLDRDLIGSYKVVHKQLIRTLELFPDPSCRMTTGLTGTLPEEEVRPLSDWAEDIGVTSM